MGKAYEIIQQGTNLLPGARAPEREWDHQEWKALVKQAKEVEVILQGRSLLWPEVEALLHKRKLKTGRAELAHTIQLLYLQGKVRYKPGVELSGPAARWICHRCLAGGSLLKLSACARCGERCAGCEQCLLLGKSRSCIPFLLFGNGDKKKVCGDHAFTIPFSLTSAQQGAVQKIERFLTSTEHQLLVWAVTGAGKTEIMVPGVGYVLEQGGKVLWTTPRKDVVHELAPRLKKLLPKTKVCALYGGSPDLWLDGAVVVATAHQTWRFYQYFDLAIIDEVDAFPLYGNKALEQGIVRALRQSAKQILLTATPPPEWKSMVRSGRLGAVTLPVRYHGYPLPVPELIREWGLWKKLRDCRPISPLSAFLKRMKQTEGQALLFVPRVQDVKTVLLWLKEREPETGCQAAGVFGQDRQREKTMQLFRERKLQVVVTTTILERGVTVPRCHVLVIGADHPVFDRPSLIQIAGRVGRSGEYQQGEVRFLANEKTEAQNQAKKEIEWLNQLAKRL
nr:helicase-related protein [Paenactinomyces guangxiensis]